MAEKLTPRVGDRVIVRKGPGSPHRTLAGTVKAIDADLVWVVRDGYMNAFGYDPIAVEVVDREPVEWPRYPMWRYGDYSYIENRRITSGIWGVKESVGGSTTVTNEAASAISADDARKIGKAWLKVAEHWDDLTR